jgi:hypothetical protein
MYGLVFYGDKFASKVPYPGSYEYLVTMARRRLVEDAKGLAEIRNSEGHLVWVGYEEDGQVCETELGK